MKSVCDPFRVKYHSANHSSGSFKTDFEWYLTFTTKHLSGRETCGSASKGFNNGLSNTFLQRPHPSARANEHDDPSNMSLSADLSADTQRAGGRGGRKGGGGSGLINEDENTIKKNERKNKKRKCLSVEEDLKLETPKKRGFIRQMLTGEFDLYKKKYQTGYKGPRNP